ncbi:carboxymuconolactone decarboxylase family protein [Microlunatus sp. GCM10028923]|uniref:carboxymuconolactone decarboxylase family protein n=1 Tax=Microlunatus sp. GCM10028923 TaxID=3273400 RepID=UPI0036105FE0
MNARLQLIGNPAAMPVMKAMMGAHKALAGSSLPASLQELVSLRASQLNGCGPCIDMHTKEAAAAGETSERLNLVAAWREATVFTDAERAALELTEHGTRLADSPEGVRDDVWQRATEHFDEDQLTTLVMLIAMINSANRINVITRQQAGGYQAGAAAAHLAAAG